LGAKTVYKSTDSEHQQLSFFQFNASCGMQLDSQNEWVKDANRLPWKVWEASYASMFPGIKGCVAKPCRMVIGSFIIQQRMGFSDRDLVKQIQENPYYQYFIGLESFQHIPPFVPTLLVEWRKRINVSFVIKANDALCDAMPKERRNKKSFGLSSRGTLVATQVCDATVAPQNIRFSQDTSLLNEARTKLEKMIDWFCSQYGLKKPRMYRKVAHKEYLAFAKSKKPSIDRIRLTIRQQLGYVSRDLKYVDSFIQGGYELERKFLDDLETIRKVYEQQKYMLENNTHKVADRIVSISQPYVRPVVRGKVSKPTEFGAKLHLSVDEYGFARIEYLSFDAYNEGPMLIQALEAYKYHHGCYPERVLVDQIYRTRPNIAFCQKNGIRISGPRLGRPAKNDEIRRKDAKTAAQDNADRIQIERYFSTAKRRNGMGLITKKREDTSLTTIALSVLVTNIFGSFKLAVEELETDSSTTA
jgi:hypothetical protein